jgi:hypothetical protein
MSNYVIIGIHGLYNKPRKEHLSRLWSEAILDGLRRNEGRTSPEAPSFELVFWADVLHGPERLEDWDYPVWDKPGPFQRYEDGFWDALRAQAWDALDTPLDLVKRWIGADPISDIALRHVLTDLGRYYHEAGIRDALQGRLRAAIEAAHDADRRIMVIGHSMGSIVAYDTLRAIGKQRRDIAIDHFVTIGAPLGLPQVKFRVAEENDLVRTPSIVRKWTNQAERRDPIAFDTHLAGDFKPNDAGVQVHDDLVCNDTVPEREPKTPGEINHHSIFGYLRTPEMSRLIRQFI